MYCIEQNLVNIVALFRITLSKSLSNINNSFYLNKRELNQLLPQNNKGLKGHFERFEFFY